MQSRLQMIKMTEVEAIPDSTLLLTEKFELPRVQKHTSWAFDGWNGGYSMSAV